MIVLYFIDTLSVFLQLLTVALFPIHGLAPSIYGGPPLEVLLLTNVPVAIASAMEAEELVRPMESGLVSSPLAGVMLHYIY